ncbi:putative chromate transport protein (fragment) [Cupriavidus metallidurans CH34]|uniref:Chromate transport protein n=1 Tax=Cupriavidus metallidurans (strain ATCC 43123 / DSM 2839 / NBRC 102507 / CH34) TaxID=266264 RepID=D3DXM4_CUPMC
MLFMLLLTLVLYSETHISVLVSGALTSVWPF